MKLTCVQCRRPRVARRSRPYAGVASFTPSAEPSSPPPFSDPAVASGVTATSGGNCVTGARITVVKVLPLLPVFLDREGEVMILKQRCDCSGTKVNDKKLTVTGFGSTHACQPRKAEYLPSFWGDFCQAEIPWKHVTREVFSHLIIVLKQRPVPLKLPSL